MAWDTRKPVVGKGRFAGPGKSVEDDPAIASVLRRGRKHLRGLAGRPVEVPDQDEDVRRGYHRARGGGLLLHGSSTPSHFDDDD
jgi:hypothetical protein